MITAITPTGDRPEVFELCRKWMDSQTKAFDQWVVVDDGVVPLSEELRVGVNYVRREPIKGEGHTLIVNFKVALPYIKGDKILIIEDDDWYGPDYIKTMSDYLDQYDLVGEAPTRYYHVPTMRCRRVANTKHASLCQTGFKKVLLPKFEKCLVGDPYLDIRFWAAVKDGKCLFQDIEDVLHLHCGMKGLKGRKGIGSGHNSKADYYQPDYGLNSLIRWVGEENARIYIQHVGQSFESAKLISMNQKNQKVAPRSVLPSIHSRVVVPRPAVPRPAVPRPSGIRSGRGSDGRRIMPKNWR